MLKNLKAEMIRNGVTGGQMAEAIKIHPATLSAKISEKRVMTWNEVKYSLQGTTQGNGLTGGVPPVRFSM